MSLCFCVLVLFLCYFVQYSSQSCPLEYSPSDSEVPFQWISSNRTNNEVVFSDPVCYDNAERVAHKICSNDRWSPPSTLCYHFYSEQENFVKDEFQPCFFIMDRQPWKRCMLPRTNFCPRNMEKVKTLWMPYKRIVKYGPFVSMVLGSSYGKIIGQEIEISRYNNFTLDEFFRRECLYLNTTSNLISSDYCDATHTLNCTFEEELNSLLCPENCIFSMSFQTCLCKVNSNNCGEEPYALVENPNQKYLMQKLANKRGCYLGGRRPINLREAINNQFWFYTDQNLDCSFCMQSKKNCRNTKLDLNFHENENNLYLSLYKPSCVFGKGDSSKIYCFTDASDALIKRVKVEEVFRGDNDAFIVYKVELEDLIGNYWCIAHNAPFVTTETLSNKVLAYRKKHNEFSVMISVKNACLTKSCVDSENYSLTYQEIARETSYLANTYNFYVRVMEVPIFNKLTILLLIHMSSLNNTYSASGQIHSNQASQAYEDYKKLSKLLLALSNDTQVISYKSSDFCFEEKFQGFSWPTARGNEVVTPKEFCISKKGVPVFRSCVGNFMNGYRWSDVSGQCYSETPSHYTEELKYAVDKPICVEGLKHVSNITKHASTDLQVMDIYYIAEILNNVSAGLNKTVEVVNDTLEIINGILDATVENIKEAQVTMNLTDELMLVTEDISCSLDFKNNLGLIIKENLIFHIFNPFESDISGFVLYNNYSIKNIKVNQNFDYLEDIDNALLAMYIPSEIIDDLVLKNLTNTSIYTTIFLNDKFVSSSKNLSSGIVVNVNIPPYKAFLPHDIHLLFRFDANEATNFSCAFWDLGNNFQRRKGDWSDIGSTYFGELRNQSRLQLCAFSHLTHFGLLVLEKSEDLTPGDTNTMNLLTAVGCFLSIIGIIGIFITAYLFNKWRERTGTQILLHLSTATLLEILFMYLNALKLLNCQFSGITLHYVILSKFSWMLVYAFCQYLRFVKVLGPMPKQLVLKSIIVGWGAPLVPVIIVSSVDPITYTSDENNFCYPIGNSLYYGIYLPISVILIINLFIFIRIFIYLSQNNLSGAKMIQARQYELHKRLFILLFFVLGIPWIFGLLANAVRVRWVKTTLALIFTATSSLQGFIMFLFYVILNKETREFWRRSFRKYDVTESEKHISNGSTSISFINFKRN